MRSKIVTATLVLTNLLASLLAIDAQAQQLRSASPAMQASVAPQRGSLYRVTHQGNTAYLFGTLHVGLPDFYPLEPRVTEALAKAGRLAVEIDIRDQQSFARALGKYGYYPGRQTIDQHLSADSYARLLQTLARFALPVEQVRHMKPWLLANLLLGLELERRGYARSHGLESFLLNTASVQAKPVLELESAEYQLSLFDGMPPAQQEQYLRESLIELDSGNAFIKAKSLIDAWSRADDSVLNAFLQQAANDGSVSSAFIQRTLLGKRNPEMAGKIEGLLQTEPTSFVGVGLLHLAGESGLPTLLRARGYAVEKLY